MRSYQIRHTDCSRVLVGVDFDTGVCDCTVLNIYANIFICLIQLYMYAPSQHLSSITKKYKSYQKPVFNHFLILFVFIDSISKSYQKSQIMSSISNKDAWILKLNWSGEERQRLTKVKHKSDARFSAFSISTPTSSSEFGFWANSVTRSSRPSSTRTRTRGSSSSSGRTP